MPRSDLAGWAGYGYGRSHARWYWRLKPYLLACPDGMPVAWCLANPKLGERDVAAVLPDRAARQRVLRPGVVVLADKGLAGRAFAATVAEFGAVLVRPDRTNEPARFGSLGGVRQSASRSARPRLATWPAHQGMRGRSGANNTRRAACPCRHRHRDPAPEARRRLPVPGRWPPRRLARRTP